MSLASVLAAFTWPTASGPNITPIGVVRSLACILIISACADTPVGSIGANAKRAGEESHIPNESDQRPLRASALRALLSDVNVLPAQPPREMMSHPPGEIFRADGSYVQFERTRMFGRFDIRGRSVCVQGDGFPRICRHVVPRGGNTYLFVNSSDGSSILMTITPHQ